MKDETSAINAKQLLDELRQTRNTSDTSPEGMDFARPDTRTDMSYTTYSLTARGRERIECYDSVVDAVEGMLELWPEDDEGDAVIEDDLERAVVYFARSEGSPDIVHVYFMGDDVDQVLHVESYRCHYEPALGGSVRTVIRRLG